MKTIGIMTSGGDAPGMNAAVRAVVRSALARDLKVFGIQEGYAGLLKNKIEEMKHDSVSNILYMGGTILYSSRCNEFRKKEGRTKAAETLRRYGIDALVVIGGDGSITGAGLLMAEHGFPVIGLPGTIDNDLYGTDVTIGFDTAINTAVEAIDKICDTARSHDRVFFVEVMGRDAGHIAIMTAIGCGADALAIPENEDSIQHIADRVKKSRISNKHFSLVVTAEGKTATLVSEVVERVKQDLPTTEVRYMKLGHIQRGGAPSAFDRVLASRMGLAAVDGLLGGKKGVMVGVIDNRVTYTPFNDTLQKHKDIDPQLIELSNLLS